jgi:hypothetical protein
VDDRFPGTEGVQGFEIERTASMIGSYSSRGGTVGFFAKLFGTDGGHVAKRTIAEGQICAKCGQPVSRENMAFDSGGGRPIHRTCPDEPPEAPNE